MKIEELFSPDPVERLRASEKLEGHEEQELLRAWLPLPQVYGSGNAWMITVGPSPGVGTACKSPRMSARPSTRLPVFGMVCPTFESEKWKKMPFARRLLAVVENGFRDNAALNETENSCLKIFLHMNLDINPEGHEKRISQKKLDNGLRRFQTVFNLVKPRLVVALSKRTCRTILTGIRAGLLGPGIAVGVESTHALKRRVTYEWKSCWLEFPGQPRALLTRIPQHPIKAPTIQDYDKIVGRYLADRVREIIGSDRSSNLEATRSACAA
jgi:hypothetical protein